MRQLPPPPPTRPRTTLRHGMACRQAKWRPAALPKQRLPAGTAERVQLWWWSGTSASVQPTAAAAVWPATTVWRAAERNRAPAATELVQPADGP